MHKIISRPDIMDCLIEISNFQGGCILLYSKDEKGDYTNIAGEYYRCERCNEWFEIDDIWQWQQFDLIFCTEECATEFFNEVSS